MEPDVILDADNPQSQRKQQTIKEMQRRSQDRILIHNPMEADYTVKFDGIGFIVPGRNKDNGHGLGNAVVFRYVALNFLTQMIDLILNTKLDDAVLAENDRRAKLGMLPMTKFIGGEELGFTQGLRTDNMEARRKLTPILWLGLAERYGSETKEETLSGKPKDDRPLDERLLAEMENKIPTTKNPLQEPVVDNVGLSPHSTTDPLEDLQNKDVFTLRKMAREKGIAVEKTAKKDELIKAISQ